MNTIFLLHHSHTDIGYTQMQQRITRWQIDFIRQALQIAAKQPDFVWNCEQFWAVECFWKQASQTEKEAFVTAVKAGQIGLSGNYLNFNELIDQPVLQAVTSRARSFGSEIGHPVTSAMTADVNGFGWGYAQTLLDCGISNFFTCVHTHHGMYPLFKKQTPFWWETTTGEKLLVWNGEHYHFGNELGAAPLAGSSYQIKDECDHHTVYHDWWKMAETRIPRYIAQLEKENYPYDFVPLMVSGLRTDNAPPSPRITEMIRRWNAEHVDIVKLKMVTLEQFFAHLRQQDVPIPTYRGDWPDWWSDGMAANPDYTAIFRNAQRTCSYLHALQKRYPQLPKLDFSELETNLALYAEHTFSHASSMHNPWHPMVKGISARKKAFAVRAFELADTMRDEMHGLLGETALSYQMPLRYKVINPGPKTVSNPIALEVGHFEFIEKHLDAGCRVMAGNTKIPHQIVHTSTGVNILVWPCLDAGEEQLLEIVPHSSSPYAGTMIDNTTLMGSDRVYDIAQDSPKSRLEETFLQTPYVTIGWDASGICRWIERKSGRQMLRPSRAHNAFVPVYERSSRRNMGRNRKAFDVQRHAGVCRGVKESKCGALFGEVVLQFECPGFEMFEVVVRAWNVHPRVDVAVRMLKTAVWDAENVYLSLPFFDPAIHTLKLDKAGCSIEPWRDQLPGTLTDFYSVQSGLTISDKVHRLAITTADANLIQLGSLEYQPRLLMGMEALSAEPAHLYSWLMTNYWETNFEASLGGFYEFNFHLSWSSANSKLHSADALLPLAVLRMKE